MGRLTIEENFKEWNSFRTEGWEKIPEWVKEFKQYCTTWGYEEEDVDKFLEKKGIEIPNENKQPLNIMGRWERIK